MKSGETDVPYARGGRSRLVLPGASHHLQALTLSHDNADIPFLSLSFLRADRPFKCDQNLPSCNNCVRHGSTCSFLEDVQGAPSFLSQYLPRRAPSNLPSMAMTGSSQNASALVPLASSGSSSSSDIQESRASESYIESAPYVEQGSEHLDSRLGFLVPFNAVSYFHTFALPPAPRDAIGVSVVTPSFGFNGTHQERQAFDDFLRNIAFELSGHYDKDFWNTIVPQASHREKPIRHATLALSGLIQQTQHAERPGMPKSPDLDEGVFALQHYNQAIRELTLASQRGQLSLDVCLITCLLFVAFEVSMLED